MATSEGIPSSIDIEFLELNDNPYLIGDKECFKIFYPRFFAWVNLFLLNHIILCSLLFPFQSIQTYVARAPVF